MTVDFLLNCPAVQPTFLYLKDAGHQVVFTQKDHQIAPSTSRGNAILVDSSFVFAKDFDILSTFSQYVGNTYRHSLSTFNCHFNIINIYH